MNYASIMAIDSSSNKLYINSLSIKMHSKSHPLKTFTYLLFLSLVFTACAERQTSTASTSENVFIQESAPDLSEELRTSLEGKWQLDSVVFTDNKIRGKQQSTLTTPIWSFDKKGAYTVTIHASQTTLTIVNNNDEEKSDLKGEIPEQTMRGRYSIKDGKLITNIMGGATQYEIVNTQEGKLHLRSQRFQVPPISKEEAGKIAEHYFSAVRASN